MGAALAKVARLRLRNVEAKLVDLRALDLVDIEILRFVDPKRSFAD